MRLTRTHLARVIGCLSPGRLTLEIDSHRTIELTASRIPSDLHRPNTEFLLVYELGRGLVAVLRWD